MIYMMQQIAPGPYKTAHYTIATALMGACMMLTGAVSGYLQKWVGYQWFFIIVLARRRALHPGDPPGPLPPP